MEAQSLPSLDKDKPQSVCCLPKRQSIDHDSAAISIIIPIWSGENLDPSTILRWAGLKGVREIILVGTPDCTEPSMIAHAENINFLRAPATGRGIQMNTGAAAASGDVLLFQHIDTELTPAHIESLTTATDNPSWIWGAFYRKFDDRHPALRWLEKPERVHCRWFGSLYGDQSLFVRRTAFEEHGGYAKIPLMEDIEFSDRMRRSLAPLLLDPPIASSPRRHLQRGSWKTTLRNLLMIARYRLGACPKTLHSEYYQSKKAIGAVTALLALCLTFAASAAEPWEGEYARLLAAYAKPEGVRYAAWHANAADKNALTKIADAIAKSGPSVPGTKGKLAYHINAYNIWMLRLVLDAYPVDSIREIAPLFGVFTGQRIEVAGQRMSLNHLEKQVIIRKFGEPRIHFAINCASVSCPPLLNEPFTASKLETQLEDVTRTFLKNEGPHSYLIKGDKIRVSKIFDWYGSEFEPPGIINTINRYRLRPVPESLKVSFLEYDWALNSAK